MKGEVSQLVTLASAANGILFGCPVPTAFYPHNACFTFCNSVRFVDLERAPLGRLREVERHRDPNEWLSSLKPNKAIRAWLTYKSADNPPAPDHQLAAFVGGGGEWQLAILRKGSVEAWIPRWDATKRDATDKHIWRVTYGCLAKKAAALAFPQPQLSVAASRLLSSLRAVCEFATTHDLPFWAGWFQRAIDSLDPSERLVFPDDVKFVCQDWYPETAQRLLAAAYNGWVFGGMGSWNDLYFGSDSENSRYTSISRELYYAMTDAIQQATWSFGSRMSSRADG